MEDAFLKHIKEHSKVTAYVLPLLKLSKFSFGEDNFVESWINHDGHLVCVEIKDLAPVILHSEVVNDPTLFDIRSLGLRQHYEMWFRIPLTWYMDISMFLKGRYSLMSEEAKAMIRTYSGMPYRVPDPNDGMLYTDFLLLALDKNVMLKDKWEERIDERISKSSELINPPDSRDFKEYAQ